MAPRLGLLLALLSVAALLPASASAARPATVKVLECDADAASATFESTMRTVAGASRLSVSFALQARGATGRWAAVKVPGFSRWLTARSGRTTFVYDKTIDGLAAPGSYRVVVRYRWRDAGGGLVQKARRTSRACEQPDPRPDLRPVALERTTTGWVLTVANAGAGDAEEGYATLAAGGRPLRELVPALGAGDETGVYFDVAPCRPGETLTATVDPDDDVEESDEAGNAISVTCPAS